LEHCGEHRLILEDRNANWFGICLEGERSPADGPTPLPTSGPLPMHFEYSGQVPPGFVLLERPDTGFLVPGLIVLAGSYGAAQLYYLFANWSAWSLIPFAGPLIQFFTSQGTITTGTEGHFGIALAFTAAQLLGTAGIVVGIVKPIRWLERSSVTIAPSPGGVAMFGTF
jgi:hypothetical protein